MAEVVSNSAPNSAAALNGSSDVNSTASSTVPARKDTSKKGMAEHLRKSFSKDKSSPALDNVSELGAVNNEPTSPSTDVNVDATVDAKEQKTDKKEPNWKAAHDEKHQALKMVKQSLAEKDRAISDRDLQIKQLKSSIELLENELNSKVQVLRSNNLWDDTADKLSMYELKEAAREAQQKLVQEHQQFIQQQQEQQQKTQYQMEYKQQINDAIAKYPLASFSDVKQGMIAVFQQNPNITAEEVAAKIHEDRLLKAKPYYQKETVAPQVITKPGVSAGFKRTNDAKGMAAWLRANIQR